MRIGAHVSASGGMADAAGLRPLFIHAPYLVNFASKSDQFLARSSALRATGIARTRATVLPLLDGAGAPNRWGRSATTTPPSELARSGWPASPRSSPTRGSSTCQW